MAGGSASIRKRSQGDNEGWQATSSELKALRKSIKRDLSLLERMEERLMTFSVSKEDLQDLSRVDGKVRDMYRILFASLKASGLYPSLLDRDGDEREDEARRRREKEEDRIMSLSPEGFENDYNERYNVVIADRDTWLAEIGRCKFRMRTLETDRAAVEEKRKHCVENHSPEAVILQYVNEVKAIDSSIVGCNAELGKYSDLHTKCEAVLSYCHGEIDPKVSALPLMSAEGDIRDSCRNYVVIRDAMERKRIEYKTLDKNRAHFVPKKKLTSAVSEARIVNAASADGNNNAESLAKAKRITGKEKSPENFESEGSEASSSGSSESEDDSESSSSDGSEVSSRGSGSEGSGRSSASAKSSPAGKKRSTRRSEEKSPRGGWSTSRAGKDKKSQTEEQSARKRKSSNR